MEIPGAGTVALETPAEELKPFFRRKFKTMFRSFCIANSGVMTKEDLMVLAEKMSKKFTPNERDKFIKQYTAVWNDVILFGRQRITEEEFVDECMKRAFTDPETRRSNIQKMLPHIKCGFDPVDLNKDGLLQFKEFKEWFQLHGVSVEKTKEIFEEMDKNSDHVISLAEFKYAMINHHMCSGPESLFSLWFGNIIDE